MTDAAKNATQNTPKASSKMPLDEAYKILNVTKDVAPEELQSVPIIVLYSVLLSC